MQRKPSHATTESTLFAVSKGEWNTKEDTDKFIVHTYCDIPKGTSWAKVMSNSEISKPVALAVICLSIQLVSQLVSK